MKKTLAFFGRPAAPFAQGIGVDAGDGVRREGREGVVGLIGEDIAVGEEQDAGAAHGLAGKVPLCLKQLPRDLEGDGGLARPRGKCQQDAPVAPSYRLKRRRNGLVLIIAGLPFAAVGLELHGSEGVAPVVPFREGPVPQVVRRREGQEHIALVAGRHVDAVPLQPVRGIGEAGSEAAGVVLGLPDSVAVAEARALGLQHGELLPLVEQDIIAGQALAAFAAGLDAAGADHFPADAGAFDDAPAGRPQHRIDPLRAGIGLGLVVQAHGSRLTYVSSPAKARCRMDWRRSSRSLSEV